MQPVGLLLCDSANESSLLRLARCFDVPIISELLKTGDPHLCLQEAQLTLCIGVAKQKICHSLNFNHSARFKAVGSDPLLRAMGGQNRTVLDLTAGWGKDAQFLAVNGYTVHALERNPTVAFMLAQAWKNIDDLELARCLCFYHHDSRAEMLQFVQRSLPKVEVDVVYIDPMFPPKTRRSAAVKKELVLLQTIVEPFADKDDSALLASALKLNPKRVVVKRPLKARCLLGPNPSGSIKGKLIRFDIYSPR